MIRAIAVRRTLQKVSLASTSGRVLARNVASPHDLPFFDNSAMDGYAVRGADTKNASKKNPVSLRVIAIVAAGERWKKQPLGTGETVRIFTGAMIPPGADAVVKQEEVIRQDQQIVINRPVKAGENIRYRGEEIKKGDLLLEAGEILNPAAIGLLSNVGLTQVPIVSPPKIGLIVTGSEIVTTGKALATGKIFDSNSPALTAALRGIGIAPAFVKRAPDSEEAIRRSVSEGLRRSDFLIVTGGVSVGDFDFVKAVVQKIGFKEIFWKVRQKPGKPVWFGKRGGKFLFGLPGNPASVLVCFYEYVRPALLQSIGAKEPFLPRLFAPLNGRFEKKAGMTHLLKGRLCSEGGRNFVKILEHQGSHMMTSFARANCLVVIPEGKERVEKGEKVEIHLLF